MYMPWPRDGSALHQTLAEPLVWFGLLKINSHEREPEPEHEHEPEGKRERAPQTQQFVLHHTQIAAQILLQSCRLSKKGISKCGRVTTSGQEVIPCTGKAP
jgi:hypothetical protein